MKKIQIKLIDKRLGNEFPMPDYATQGSAGLDLCSCINESLIVNPNSGIKDYNIVLNLVINEFEKAKIEYTLNKT